MRLSRHRVHIDTSNLVPRSSSIVKLKEREDKGNKKKETRRQDMRGKQWRESQTPIRIFGQRTAEILGIVVPGGFIYKAAVTLGPPWN
jgi:hypothetical protein